MNYKLGLVSVSFRQHSPRQILEAMKECGLDCIEWGSDVHVPVGCADGVAELQREYGIKCSSYGTYFRLGVNSLSELQGYINTAKSLGTKVLRLWCGDKNSEEYSDSEREALFLECASASEIARENGVIFCMECHINSYTNLKDSAEKLMRAVGSEHFRMYWQPNQFRTDSENIESAKLLSTYTENIHVFNWRGNEKYPMAEATEIWMEYLKHFGGNNTLLLEFMPDDRIETLRTEAEALKNIVKGLK